MELKQIENQTLPSITCCADGRKWWANFEFYPEVVAERKTVFRGYMYSEDNFFSQTDCAVKFDDPSVTEEDLVKYVEGVTEVYKLANLFNATLKGIRIIVLLPCVAVMDKVAPFYNRMFRLLQRNYNRVITGDDCVLLEERVQGQYVSFTDPEGKSTNKCPTVIQQFAHFCFHETKGQLVVTNLQGIEKDSTIVLSSPVIHSVESKYGSRDKGTQGIATFFNSFHSCCEGCKTYLSCKDFVNPSAPPTACGVKSYLDSPILAAPSLSGGTLTSGLPSYSASEASNAKRDHPPPYEATFYTTPPFSQTPHFFNSNDMYKNSRIQTV
ncbi:uncharacterized protein LOC133188833 [Saccostrea echinata]|uniref:uncharacterized protein LOC133188833 n=1 Tax=Saccostrea echinata TaxID=191078 RepID=UPI002A80192D|nr:uncharacterized protein LOC133188833 [Saccostrea echinata]